MVLQWVFYHEALSTFSCRHYLKPQNPARQECLKTALVQRQAVFSENSSKISTSIGCSPQILGAICNLCSYYMDPKDDRFDAAHYHEELDRIERLLVYCKQDEGDEHDFQDTSSVPATESRRVAELYRLAGLVYLYRQARGLSATSPRVRKVLSTAMAIMEVMQGCSRPFPVAILGAEARSDEDRLVVLSLIRRTQAMFNAGSIHRAQKFIEACWAQEDLRGDQELDYRKKLDTIISSSQFLPTFA
jgi:hypothetical protein